MRFILDMVHHNPGEPPFQTAFLDPAHLAEYGYNGQVFKHINCVAEYDALGLDLFPAGSPERAWLERFRPGLEREIEAAKSQGLSVFYHLDLFVLPRRLVEHFRQDICDQDTGRILLDRPKTLELHRVLFDELSRRFPRVDGYIIRVGETYLFDTPFHVGNGPIPRLGPAWTPTYLYEHALGKADAEPSWSAAQADAYVRLLNFLREELCVKHGKYLMFRTWDIFPDKLHAVPAHYLDVSDRVEPHPKLLFSIKHTALDFWRRVKVNECLGQGRHPQIIEVQCQREYEGKGAYPNYVMDGVIHGFEENERPIGLAELLRNPLIRGVYGWSRGGGWYGPYIQDELWCDLNAFVLGRFVADPARGEPAHFDDYARRYLGLAGDDPARFRDMVLLAARAILKGRCCAAFDQVLRESILPTALWMRDDRLGGGRQLEWVLDYLAERDLFDVALEEKAEAVRLWDQVREIAHAIHWPDHARRDHVLLSIEYGGRLFQVVERGWRVLIEGRRADREGHDHHPQLAEAIARLDDAWQSYRELKSHPRCPSLYEGRYFNLPGAPDVPGLDETVDHYRRKIADRS